MRIEIIEKMVKGNKLEQADVETILHDICEDVHASCFDACPVYDLNGGKVPWKPNPDGTGEMCPHHKDGASMFQFIKERIQ